MASIGFNFTVLPTEIRAVILSEVVLAATHSADASERLAWVHTADNIIDVNPNIGAELYNCVYQREPRYRPRGAFGSKDPIGSAALFRLSGRLEMRFRHRYEGVILDGFQFEPDLDAKALDGSMKYRWLVLKYSGQAV